MSSEGTHRPDPWLELKELVANDSDLRRYLDLSFKPFHSTGEWPDIEKLQRQLLRDHEHVDLYSVGDRIPNDLGTNPVRVENRCQLTIAGVALCAGSEEEVGDFLKVLALASDKYLSETSEGSIGSDELRQ